MPIVFRERGFRVFFYSNEGDPREPVHVHVTRAGAEAKLWLYPSASIAYNRGFSARTQAELLQLVEDHHEAIERSWHEHFGQTR